MKQNHSRLHLQALKDLADLRNLSQVFAQTDEDRETRTAKRTDALELERHVFADDLLSIVPKPLTLSSVKASSDFERQTAPLHLNRTHRPGWHLAFLRR